MQIITKAKQVLVNPFKFNTKMKKVFLSLIAGICALGAFAQPLTATWQMSDPENLSQVKLNGNETAISLVSTGFESGI